MVATQGALFGGLGSYSGSPMRATQVSSRSLHPCSRMICRPVVSTHEAPRPAPRRALADGVSGSYSDSKTARIYGIYGNTFGTDQNRGMLDESETQFIIFEKGVAVSAKHRILLVAPAAAKHDSAAVQWAQGQLSCCRGPTFLGIKRVTC